MEALSFPLPSERPDLWPWALRAPEGKSHVDLLDWSVGGESLRGFAARVGAERFCVVDGEDLCGQLDVWATAFFEEFWDGYGMGGAYALYRGWGCRDERVLAALRGAGVVVECADRASVDVAVAAGVPAALMRVALNEDTASVFADYAESAQWLVTCVPGEQWRVPADFSGCVALDFRGLVSSSFVDAARECEAFAGGRRWHGLCVPLVLSPGVYGAGVESSMGALSEGLRGGVGGALDLLKRVGGEHLLVSVVSDVSVSGVGVVGARPFVEPVGATLLARSLAAVVRQECVARQVRVPVVDVEPCPSVIEHSIIRVNIHTGSVLPGVGQDSASLPVFWL